MKFIIAVTLDLMQFEISRARADIRAYTRTIVHVYREYQQSYRPIVQQFVRFGSISVFRIF
jgi:hypothetical protein